MVNLIILCFVMAFLLIDIALVVVLMCLWKGEKRWMK